MRLAVFNRWNVEPGADADVLSPAETPAGISRTKRNAHMTRDTGCSVQTEAHTRNSRRRDQPAVLS